MWFWLSLPAVSVIADQFTGTFSIDVAGSNWTVAVIAELSGAIGNFPELITDETFVGRAISMVAAGTTVIAGIRDWMSVASVARADDASPTPFVLGSEPPPASTVEIVPPAVGTASAALEPPPPPMLLLAKSEIKA